MKCRPPPPRKNGILKKSLRKSAPEIAKHKKENKTSKYNTRQSVRNSAEVNNSLDTPSTSTGITSSKNTLYRVIEQDSDEEPRNTNENREDDNVTEENNFVNILPTPLNGTRDIFINVLEVDNASRLNR